MGDGDGVGAFLDGLRATADRKLAIAERLLADGAFADALLLYREVAAVRPDDRDAHSNIAALLTRLAGQEQGQAHMRAYFARHPLSGKPPAAEGGRPLVLKLRGFDRTRILLARHDGKFGRKLRGGHFTTTYLLDAPRFRTRTFTIAAGNILRPGAVPPNALLLNTIAEPDIEAASLDSLEAYLARHPDTPIVNRPEAVRETARDRNYRRLRGFGGVRFPRTQRLCLAEADLPAVRAELDRLEVRVPFILREVGTQTGRTTVLIERPEQLAQAVGKGLSGDHYVIDYHPILWEGEYFRKLRLFCIGGRYFPVVCHLDRVWNVHGGNRKELMRGDERLMAEERRFLADWRSYVGAEAAEALDRLVELVRLDFFGIDFTVDDAGAVFVYELNPAMRHSFDHAKIFPYKLPYDQAITAAFTRMVEARLGPVPAGPSGV